MKDNLNNIQKIIDMNVVSNLPEVENAVTSGEERTFGAAVS